MDNSYQFIKKNRTSFNHRHYNKLLVSTSKIVDIKHIISINNFIKISAIFKHVLWYM